MSGVRLRLYVAGELADERWAKSGEEMHAAAQEQSTLAGLASGDGKLWLVECYDPDMPPGAACVRFGTDTPRMTFPVEVSR